MYDELELNQELCAKSYGTPVKFNQIIQLLHIQSQKFLTFLPTQSSEYETDNMAVELGDRYCDETKFRLQPVYNF
jgi:Inositol 1,4,5-trisphosphate/ryanodine receptor